MTEWSLKEDELCYRKAFINVLHRSVKSYCMPEYFHCNLDKSQEIDFKKHGLVYVVPRRILAFHQQQQPVYKSGVQVSIRLGS